MSESEKSPKPPIETGEVKKEGEKIPESKFWNLNQRYRAAKERLVELAEDDTDTDKRGRLLETRHPLWDLRSTVKFYEQSNEGLQKHLEALQKFKESFTGNAEEIENTLDELIALIEGTLEKRS